VLAAPLRFGGAPALPREAVVFHEITAGWKRRNGLSLILASGALGKRSGRRRERARAGLAFG
jgi:hypothetical protein